MDPTAARTAILDEQSRIYKQIVNDLTDFAATDATWQRYTRGLWSMDLAIAEAMENVERLAGLMVEGVRGQIEARLDERGVPR